MNNKKRGIGLWVVVLVCVFIGIIVSEGWNLLTTSDYSYSDFQQDIQTKAEQIEDVVISPNKETPTGMISVEWKNSSKEESFYVTDVNQVKEWLESVNYTDYKETDVINREGWFYNNGALLVLGGIFLWFLFSFINSQINSLQDLKRAETLGYSLQFNHFLTVYVSHIQPDNIRIPQAYS